MFESLSEPQQEIVFNKVGRFVVRACPGSGKTYTVAAKLAYQLQNWVLKHQGIATLSFTNVAWQEIERKLNKNFNVYIPLGYPHFLGTIDSFINTFIFLPFGHLAMDCQARPTLVGEPHGSWSSGRHEKDYNRYFDVISYGVNAELIYPKVSGLFHFSYNLFYKKDGTESKHAQNMREVKEKFWKFGYATQQDANYFAMRLLEKFPKIAQSLVRRFPFIIIDEAQDTSEIQMKIIDLFIRNGLEHLILVGDPDQAIFEWNDAKPELFVTKYNEWRENSVTLNENRRSSNNICRFTYKLSTLEILSSAVNEEICDYPFIPEVITYTDDTIDETIQNFLTLCRNNQIEITQENVAIICRSKSIIESLIGITPQHNNSPWKIGNPYTRDFAKGKYIYDNLGSREGFKLIEKAFIKGINNQMFCSVKDIQEQINKVGFIQHRSKIIEVIKCLPQTNCLLNEWVNKANKRFLQHNIAIKLDIDKEKGNIPFDSLFKASLEHLYDRDYRLGTVHSVKGETFEAVLLFLRKKGASGQFYKTLINSGISSSSNEELRIVYVGITRPRKILVLAVPSSQDQIAWKSKLS